MSWAAKFNTALASTALLFGGCGKTPLERLAAKNFEAQGPSVYSNRVTVSVSILGLYQNDHIPTFEEVAHALGKKAVPEDANESVGYFKTKDGLQPITKNEMSNLHKAVSKVLIDDLVLEAYLQKLKESATKPVEETSVGTAKPAFQPLIEKK